MEKEVSPTRPRKWLAVLLVVLPLWLLASGAFAVYHHIHREKSKAIEERETYTRSVSADGVREDLRKFLDIIGERHGGNETAARNLTRALAMVEGTLGPSNTGLEVRKLEGPSDWPVLAASIPGTMTDAPPVWVLATLDSRPGSPGAEANATGVAAVLAAAQAMAGDKPQATIHFAFPPHGNDPESPIIETAERIYRQTGKDAVVLCVEAMGGGEDLWLSSRDTAATPLSKVAGLGSVRGAEVVCLGDDVDLAGILFEMGVPAVRVATRPMVSAKETDDQAPDAQTVAAAAGRLVELVRRCARVR
jgi:Peptidase family M28